MANCSETALAPGNRLLRALPPDELTRLQQHLELVNLRKEQVARRAGRRGALRLFPTGWGIVVSAKRHDPEGCRCMKQSACNCCNGPVATCRDDQPIPVPGG